MKRKFKVTLGLCVKNVEKTISYTMYSILNQRFPHELIELIIVDGQSQDNTMKIINRFLSISKIKSKVFFENKGLGFARQKVVDNASADYIIWVDGDVILPYDYVEKQVKFMDKHPRVAIGRARYGIWPRANIIGFLENIPFVIETLKHDGEVPLGICGIAGAIYRLDAIREASGFDTNIKGAGEDTDLAYRIIAKGWSARLTSAVFYEIRKENWKDLWKEYDWLGYGGHFIFHKNTSIINLYKMTPLAGFLAGALKLPFAYMLTHKKCAALLPFHYAFKRLAWCIGFLKAHFDGYGHSPNKQV
ncbi:glycosyltransferase [Candidatus Bathyarchaeota archaeon]|nr:glycosyltransferase [Candidatus Bathyarchaeota archaeon]